MHASNMGCSEVKHTLFAIKLLCDHILDALYFGILTALYKSVYCYYYCYYTTI